jgi:hypothetical protein
MASTEALRSTTEQLDLEYVVWSRIHVQTPETMADRFEVIDMWWREAIAKNGWYERSWYKLPSLAGVICGCGGARVEN